MISITGHCDGVELGLGCFMYLCGEHFLFLKGANEKDQSLLFYRTSRLIRTILYSDTSKLKILYYYIKL